MTLSQYVFVKHDDDDKLSEVKISTDAFQFSPSI